MTCTAFMCHGDPNCGDTHCPGRSQAIQINGGCTVESGVAVAWTDDPAYVPDEPVITPEQPQDWTANALFAIACGIAVAMAFMPFIFKG